MGYLVPPPPRCMLIKRWRGIPLTKRMGGGGGAAGAEYSSSSNESNNYNKSQHIFT